MKYDLTHGKNQSQTDLSQVCPSSSYVLHSHSLSTSFLWHGGPHRKRYGVQPTILDHTASIAVLKSNDTEWNSICATPQTSETGRIPRTYKYTVHLHLIPIINTILLLATPPGIHESTQPWVKFYFQTAYAYILSGVSGEPKASHEQSRDTALIPPSVRTDFASAARNCSIRLLIVCLAGLPCCFFSFVPVYKVHFQTKGQTCLYILEDGPYDSLTHLVWWCGCAFLRMTLP